MGKYEHLLLKSISLPLVSPDPIKITSIDEETESVIYETSDGGTGEISAERAEEAFSKADTFMHPTRKKTLKFTTSTEAEVDGPHAHTADIDPHGNGWTDVQNGHRHRMKNWQSVEYQRFDEDAQEFKTMASTHSHVIDPDTERDQPLEDSDVVKDEMFWKEVKKETMRLIEDEIALFAECGSRLKVIESFLAEGKVVKAFQEVQDLQRLWGVPGSKDALFVDDEAVGKLSPQSLVKKYLGDKISGA